MDDRIRRAERAARRSTDEAERFEHELRRAGRLRVLPAADLELVWVPAGSFVMGSSKEYESDPQEILRGLARAHPLPDTTGVSEAVKRALDAGDIRAAEAALEPLHQMAAAWSHYPQPRDSRRTIQVSQGYWIGRYPVTWGQYRKFCESTGARLPSSPPHAVDERHPVVNVAWTEAVAFCRWVGGRLPSEVEWEYAARGADERSYPWGNEPPNAVTCPITWSDENGEFTVPVGSRPLGASPFGAMDMVGNTSQWVADGHASNEHVIRGGGVFAARDFTDAELDGGIPPVSTTFQRDGYGAPSSMIGFRLACS